MATRVGRTNIEGDDSAMDSMELGVNVNGYVIFADTGTAMIWITHQSCSYHHCLIDDTVTVHEILDWIKGHEMGHERETKIKKAST